MEFKDIVSVTGKAGLFEMIAPRANGLVATQIGDTKKTFLSARKHNFTPLENIGIYLISGETVELSSVFVTITEQKSPPKQTDDASDIMAFFDLIIPDYDEDRVKLSDMKKILQWFWILKDHDLLQLLPTTGNEEE